MKIVYVAGGSYKSFYLNHFLKLSKCDLLIFNFGIFNAINSNYLKALVWEEILTLSVKLNCVIIAGVVFQNKNRNIKNFLVCRNKNINLYSINKSFKIYIKNRCFDVGTAYTNMNGTNKIVVYSKQLIPNLKHCSKSKNYLFCSNRGINFIHNKKLKIIFNKCSKIILK